MGGGGVPDDVQTRQDIICNISILKCLTLVGLLRVNLLSKISETMFKPENSVIKCCRSDS